MARRGSIAAIIPTLNEAAHITELVERLRRMGIEQVIVVDGRSSDGTSELALEAGATVLTAPRGRGSQLADGARAADADIFWFLHADARPEENSTSIITRTLRDPQIALGCFRIAFDRRHPLLSLYAFASRFDTVFTTFGDQAFFVRRSDYEACGGFPPWPLMEDVEMRRRLRRHGKIVKARACIVTSARLFVRDGVILRQLRNAWLLARFLAGASPQKLARLYEPQPRRR